MDQDIAFARDLARRILPGHRIADQAVQHALV